MEKIFSLLLLLALLFSPLPASAGEALVDELPDRLADIEPEVFTLASILFDLETREDGVSLLTVKLPEGETALLEAAGHCRFLDDSQQALSPSDFAKRYKGKEVTIDFMERGPGLYIVEECRSGAKTPNSR
ncbi:MAG: hypothetical protein LBQ42_06665 [Synergistaceae bacterium]|jgi:hypothetical protein|nr:hypothetical protein [Synergistaceae bacterium]